MRKKMTAAATTDARPSRIWSRHVSLDRTTCVRVTHEKPSPAWQPSYTFHVIGDNSGNKTRYSAGDRYGRVEESKASGELILSVPAYISVCPVGAKVLTYQDERKKAHPGAKPASATPSRKRIPASCCQLCVAPIRAAKVPHTKPSPGRKTCGFTLVKIMFAGTSQTRYEMKNTNTMIEYWFDVRLKSSSSPAVFALPTLARSRKPSRYRTQQHG